MVFHDNRKRRQRKNRPEPKSIKDLPDELTLQILEYTSTTGILKLREASKVLAGPCTTALRARLTVLYVHPSPSSIQKAINICQSDLSTEIDEICLVNTVMWNTIRQQDSAGRFQESMDIASTWHSQKATRGDSSRQHSDARPVKAFTKAYNTLISALVDLPKVRAFSFTNTCDKPGFNMLPRTRILEYVESLHPRALSRELRAEHKLYRPREPMLLSSSNKFTDTEAVLSFLSHPGFNLAHLRITEELPHCWNIADRCTQICKSPAYGICQAKLGRLTTLELHCNTGWHTTSWQDACNQIVSLASPNLQRLKFAFQHNAATRKSRVEPSLFTILGGLEFPNLTHLELTALQPTTQNDRRHRPICQDFNIVDFITTHAATLRSLHFSNVVFNDIETPQPLLAQLRETLELCRVLGTSLTWIVNYFDHDPRCGVPNSPATRCQHECRTYCPPSHGEVTLRDILKFAIDLDVRRCERTLKWDFGRYIR